MRRLAHIIVLVAFVFSCGGQWCVLQGIAWIKMIHDYSQMVPLGEAVSMTFSGKYPCAICKAIADKQAAEHNKLIAFEKFGKVTVELQSVELPMPRVVSFSYPVDLYSLRSRSETPPTPPPRLG